MAHTSKTFPPPYPAIQKIVAMALEEDLWGGDLTSNLLISPTVRSKARIIAKEPAVVAGVLVVRETLRQVDPTLRMVIHNDDGQRVTRSTPIMTISGPGRSLLQAERVALNFLQRLSGISTLTSRFCQALRGYSTAIVDTRKTTPGLRILEKWAVRLGGGHNHRFSLNDGVLIKDNHLAILAGRKIGLTKACLLAKKGAPHSLKIGVEVETINQVTQALLGKADLILLDNMSPNQVRQAIDLIGSRAVTEVSGGVTLKNIREMAKAQPDCISVGALTHSAPAIDFSLEILSIGEPHTSRQKKL